MRVNPSPGGLLLQALCFAGIGPDDCVLDLGSGDGRFCVAAAQQFRVKHAVGVEIDDSLVKASARHAQQCDVSDRATFTTLDLTDPDLDISALAPRPHRVTLAVVFLLPESEKLFERHVRSLYDAGAHVLSLAFALDRLGLQLLMAETPMFLYGKSADRIHCRNK